jgi:hypothetical protein
MKNAVFWDVALCRSCVNRCFGGTGVNKWLQTEPPVDSVCSHLLNAGSSLADFSTFKVEAICSSETSVHTRSTQRHIPEDSILHGHLCTHTLLINKGLTNLILVNFQSPTTNTTPNKHRPVTT